VSERAAFLQAIRDQPDDDTARLVYADWLDEHDEGVLAAFIRYSVRKYRTPVCDHERFILSKLPDICEGCRVYNAYTAALTDWADAAAHGIPADDRPKEWAIDRGLFVEIGCAAEWWLRWGDAVVASQPVRRVRISSWPHGVGDVPIPDGLVEFDQGGTNGNVRLNNLGWHPAPPLTAAKTALDSSTVPWVIAVMRLFAIEWPGINFEFPPRGYYVLCNPLRWQEVS
jgi:uncharacterized protein (TIGR02996 family)